MGQIRFDGDVIAVSGAARGMGREYALLLAKLGARVVVNDIKGAEQTVATIRELGGEAIGDASDVADPAQTDAMVARAIDTWGRLDGVINNAAIYGGTLPDPDETARILGVHLTGTLNLIRSAMPVFRERSYGRILNIGSGSMFGLPGTGIYAAGKGGVYGFTKGLAKDLSMDTGRDIRVNLIMPAAFQPGMLSVTDPEMQQAIDGAFTPASIAPIAALLVHRDCPAQGEAIQVGGGRHARVVLATTEGWQAPDGDATPEAILANWPEVVAGRNPREPAGSMSDLLVRRGLPDYSVMELVAWTRTGRNPRE